MTSMSRGDWSKFLFTYTSILETRLAIDCSTLRGGSKVSGSKIEGSVKLDTD